MEEHLREGRRLPRSFEKRSQVRARGRVHGRCQIPVPAGEDLVSVAAGPKGFADVSDVVAAWIRAHKALDEAQRHEGSGVWVSHQVLKQALDLPYRRPCAGGLGEAEERRVSEAFARHMHETHDVLVESALVFEDRLLVDGI